MMNRKGITFSGLLEMLLIFMIMSLAFGGLVYTSNKEYGGTNSSPFLTGIDDALNNMTALQDSSSNQTTGGSILFSAGAGMQLGSSWAIVKFAFTTLVGLATGSWIPNLLSYILLSDVAVSATTHTLIFYIGIIARIFWTMMVVFAVLRLFFRVTP